MGEDFNQQIEDLHAQRSSLLASFCELLAGLFQDDPEEDE
jgi:hypothetical protein